MKTTLSPLAKNLRSVFAASAAISLLSFNTAIAQEQTEQSAQEAPEDVEQIAVVGTRAAPRSVGESPVPIDIISDEEFNSTEELLVKSEMKLPND